MADNIDWHNGEWQIIGNDRQWGMADNRECQIMGMKDNGKWTIVGMADNGER